MKRILLWAVSIPMLFLLAACALRADEPKGPAASAAQQSSSQAASKQSVVFSDPALEAAVRAAMNKPEGDIALADAEAVSVLNLSYEWRRILPGAVPIRALGGMECFKNLESLDLSFHEITDIAPLAGLNKLVVLSLRANPVADIAPLAGLMKLNVLALDHCAASDLSPLASLTGIKHLYLADCPVADYSPLAGIYPGLESRDFIMASTLEGLGFSMNDANNQASYGDVQRDGLSVNINHAEWGAPQSEDMAKCVRMDLLLDSGYPLVVLYYPEIRAYVFQMNINGEQMNYIYNAADGTFMMDPNNRERFERMITEALGETGETDILTAPIPVFDGAIRETFGMTADALYALPFGENEAMPERLPEQTRPAYALPYEPLGFTADAERAVCRYEQNEPHHMQIAINRPEWGENPDGWNIEFHDSNVNGYKLVMQYYAGEGKWHVYMEKDGVDCSFDNYPATGVKGWEYPSIEAMHQMVGDAFHSQGKELYDKPLEHFERVVQERFGMSLDALYMLSMQ